jgi:hypothetical protein
MTTGWATRRGSALSAGRDHDGADYYQRGDQHDQDDGGDAEQKQFLAGLPLPFAGRHPGRAVARRSIVQPKLVPPPPLRAAEVDQGASRYLSPSLTLREDFGTVAPGRPVLGGPSRECA